MVLIRFLALFWDFQKNAVYKSGVDKKKTTVNRGLDKKTTTARYFPKEFFFAITFRHMVKNVAHTKKECLIHILTRVMVILSSFCVIYSASKWGFTFHQNDGMWFSSFFVISQNLEKVWICCFCDIIGICLGMVCDKNKCMDRSR